MITQETKSMIEKEALELYPITQLWNGAYYEDTNKDTRAGYIAAAFKYVEKVELLKQDIAVRDKILRQESRDIDINYDLHEGKGENNELL